MPAGLSINDLVNLGHLDLTTVPTLVFLNAKPVLEKDFDRPLPARSHLTVVAQPGILFGTWIMIIALVITAVMALYALYLYFTMPGEGESREGSPTYSISYRIKLFLIALFFLRNT